MKTAALEHAARGWRVFPVKGKTPMIPEWQKRATTDLAVIEREWPADATGVGIATGAGSGIDVIDVDSRNGGEESLDRLEAEIGEPPQTATVRTPGGGYHLLFKSCGLKTGANLRPGIDTRGAGGYVVAAGSLHPSGGVYAFEPGHSPSEVEIAELPQAWIDALGKATSKPSPSPSPRISTVGEGGRNDHLARQAGRLRHVGLGQPALEAALLEVNRAECRPPLSDEEVKRIAASVARYAPGIDGAGAVAELIEPEPGSFGAALQRAKADLEDHRGKSVSGAPQVRFESAAEMFKREYPKAPWLVQGVLPEEAVAVIGGEPKSAKTFFGLELAVAMATATPAAGEFVVDRKHTVALFLAEDSPRSARARLAAFARGRGLDPVEALARVFVQCRGSLDLGSDEDLSNLIATCRLLPGGPPSVVLLDPLRDLHRAEENDSGAMSLIMGNLRALRSILGCSVIFVHHTSKASKDTSARRPGQRMRGSSAIHGAVDGGAYMTLKDSTGTTFTNDVEVELKAAKGAGRFTLTLEIEDDMNGEAHTARWTFDRREERVPVNDVDHVIEILRFAWLMSGGTPAPISKAELARRMKRNNAAVGIAVGVAEGAGRVVQKIQGQKSLGYVYRPTEEEKARVTTNRQEAA